MTTIALPTPSAWRYEHKRPSGGILYIYSMKLDPVDGPDYVPMFTHGQMMQTLHAQTEPIWMDAKRLALELECLLMSCDLPACSKWWDSAHEALELHRQLVKERLEQE